MPTEITLNSKCLFTQENIVKGILYHTEYNLQVLEYKSPSLDIPIKISYEYFYSLENEFFDQNKMFDKYRKFIFYYWLKDYNYVQNKIICWDSKFKSKQNVFDLEMCKNSLIFDPEDPIYDFDWHLDFILQTAYLICNDPGYLHDYSDSPKNWGLYLTDNYNQFEAYIEELEERKLIRFKNNMFRITYRGLLYSKAIVESNDFNVRQRFKIFNI